MPPITWFPKDSIASAVVLSHFHRYDNLGHCRLRIINARDDTDIASITAIIVKKNVPSTTADALTLFNEEETRAAEYDIIWEGDIELLEEDVLVIIFKEIGSGGVYPTNNDVLKSCVGVEYVKP